MYDAFGVEQGMVSKAKAPKPVSIPGMTRKFKKKDFKPLGMKKKDIKRNKKILNSAMKDPANVNQDDFDRAAYEVTRAVRRAGGM